MGYDAFLVSIINHLLYIYLRICFNTYVPKNNPWLRGDCKLKKTIPAWLINWPRQYFLAPISMFGEEYVQMSNHFFISWHHYTLRIFFAWLKGTLSILFIEFDAMNMFISRRVMNYFIRVVQLFINSMKPQWIVS